jgi:hypothetical protein
LSGTAANCPFPPKCKKKKEERKRREKGED